MKKLVLAASVLVLGTAAASAADMAPRYYKAPPPMVAAMYDWSGFYAGINGGWGTSHNCWTRTATAGVAIVRAAEGCHDSSGGTVGGQLGYRWQAGPWVFGLEAQGNWADFTGSNTSLVFAHHHQPYPHRRVRPLHRPGRLRLEQCAGLCDSGSQNLQIANARALHPFEDGLQLVAVVVVGVELTGVLHQRRERHRFAARAGAKIEHLFPRSGTGEESGDLRTLVLNFKTNPPGTPLRLAGWASAARRSAAALGRRLAK